MDIEDFHVAGARTSGNLLEDEFLRTGDVQQGQVFRRGADKNQVVVFCIVEREKTAALYANALTKQAEDSIQLVDCQHFADTRVVIQDLRFRIARRVVIAHALVGPSRKRGVAENNPGLFGASQKTLPENVKRRWRRLNFGTGIRSGIFSSDKQSSQPNDGGGE